MNPLWLLALLFAKNLSGGRSPGWPSASHPPPVRPLLITNKGVIPLDAAQHMPPAAPPAHAAPNAPAVISKWKQLAPYADDPRRASPGQRASFVKDYHAAMQALQGSSTPSLIRKYNDLALMWQRNFVHPPYVPMSHTSRLIPRIP